MTKEQFAAMLDGRQYGEELTPEEERIAKENGLVVIFGGSDDLFEIRGAIEEEFGAFGGCVFYFNRGCVTQLDDDVEEAISCLGNTEVAAVWCPEGLDCSWAYRTKLPHAEFRIYEDDELYCIGIVIDFKDVGGR